MGVAVNKSDKTVALGGTSIPPATSTDIRIDLVTEGEINDIKDLGLLLKLSSVKATVENSDTAQTVQTKVDKVDTKVDKVDTKVDKVDTKVDKVDTKVDKVDTKVDKVDTKVDKVDTKVDEVKTTEEQKETVVQTEQKEVKTEVEVLHVVYPSDVQSTTTGRLLENKTAKATIATLKEEHGEAIVTDAEFSNLYEDVNVEEYRVEQEAE